MSKLFWWFLLGLIVIKLSFFLISEKDYFLRKFDPEYFGNLYSQSQYVIGQRSKGGIGDDGLYAFAGYYYLFQLGDVSSVNFEHPPLGKYLIGLSIAFFSNENVINIIYFILLLLTTYKIGVLLLRNRLSALLTVAILSIDPLFLDNLLRSLLDLPFTLFFTIAVYFFLKANSRSSNFFISFLFWGAAFSTRFFPAFIIIYAYLFCLVFLYQRKKIRKYIVSSLLVLLVYLLSHAVFFIYHPSLVEFIRHKRWMLSWFTGAPITYGNIWRNVFTGKYLDSTGQLTIDSHWSLTTAAVVLLAVARIRKSLTKIETFPILTIYGLCLLYLIYLTFLTGGLHKFLMPIYPLLIILAISNLESLYSIINACTNWIKPQLKQK